MISHPNHPLWSFLRLLVMMLALTYVLWLNASKFDATEMQTIITMFFVAAGAESGMHVFLKNRNGPDK